MCEIYQACLADGFDEFFIVVNLSPCLAAVLADRYCSGLFAAVIISHVQH